MRILHLHKNALPYLNDDEGSISWAMRELGHEVIDEFEPEWEKHRHSNFDFTLFHHWYSAMNNAQHLPGKKVVWFFDHINFATSGVKNRLAEKHTRQRTEYLRKMDAACDYIFHTDGEWSGKHSHLLRQGADSRITKLYRKNMSRPRDLLYIGNRVSEERESFERLLTARYGRKFCVVNKVYRAKLQQTIQRYKIVVAPDSPITDRYWSNRVYVVLGCGALLLHPYCASLAEEYEDGKEIVYFHNRDDLINKIDYYLERPEECARIAEAGYQRTCKEHLYLHRVKKLLETVR